MQITKIRTMHVTSHISKVKKSIEALLFVAMLSNSSYGQTFTLKSNDLGGQFTNKHMLNSFGCNGENKSPQLEWTNAPAKTKSFAVTMYDVDAPTGSGFWHWVVYDIPEDAKELKQDAGSTSLKLLPNGAVQGNTDFGIPGYGGACPPMNDKPHTYIFTVYALKVDHLPIDKTSTAPNTGYFLNQNMLEKASLIVYCKR